MLTLAMLMGFASAQDRLDVDVTQEIVVWGDRFARWDNTRWFIETTVLQPWSTVLARDIDLEFQTQEYRIQAIFKCDKEERAGRRRYDVACVIEDIGIIANVADRRPKPARIAAAQQVLNEIDAKLTGAHMELRVGDDGQVHGIDIEGIPTRNRRQNRIQMTLTQIMSRLIVGFDLKMQKGNQLHQGVWMEQNAALLLLETNSSGSNYVKHYLDPFRGQILVQSIGKGISTLSSGPQTEFGALTRFDMHLDGVSLFDPDDGYLTERVWSITGVSNPSGTFLELEYSHFGKMRQLGTQDRPNCGLTQVVNGHRQRVPGLPDWPEAT
ncbi:MAG: hypothetical protein AAGA48_19610 [Myxococcota bacterium]